MASEQDNEENLDLNDGQDAFDRGYMEAEADGSYFLTFSFYCSFKINISFI